MVQSKRDQLQAYRFMQRRVRTALLDADPDTTEAPMSRMGAATYAGVMIAVLVLAVAGIYGVIRPGGSSAWKQPGALVVERETSTRYVYLDDVLYPVANFSSAKLLLGERLHVVSVSRRSLSRARHGGSVGIAGAPDYVPDAEHVVAATWSVCATGDPVAPTNATTYTPGVAAAGAAPDRGQGIVLRSSGQNYLLWNGTTYLIPSRREMIALRYDDAPSIAVDANLLAALTRGENLQAYPVHGIGSPGPTLAGHGATKVGQVMVDTLRRDIFYLVLDHALAYLTPLQATLLLAEPAIRSVTGGARAIALDSTGLSSRQVGRLANRPAPAQQAPRTIPAALASTAGQRVCAIYAGGTSHVVIGAQRHVAAGDASSGLVRLQTGYGAIVAAVAHGGAKPSATYLVTDTGQKFAIKDPDAITALGLGGLPQATLPASLVAAIPGTAVLDTAAARQVAGGGTAPQTR